MAERSQFWETSTTGDGAAAGYTEAQTIEWLRDIVAPFNTSGPNTSQGVLRNVMGQLATTGTSSPVSVAAGAAIVEGFYYKNDSALSVTIPTPLAATRHDRLVLRADHTTRTVRVVRLEGVEGSGAPGLTRNAGSVWEIHLSYLIITTGGVISIIDERSYCHFATRVSGDMLDSDVADGTTLELSGTNVRVKDNGISNAKLRDSAALSVIGRATNTGGDPADITAGTDGYVLRRSGTTLGFGQVVSAGIANDAIDDTKVGNRVPQFYRRQGGSSSNWQTPGASAQTPGAVRMQAGAVQVIGTGSNPAASVEVTFPVAFSQPPLVFLSAGVSDNAIVHKFFEITATGFTFNTYDANDAGISTSFTMQWLAIGAE